MSGFDSPRSSGVVAPVIQVPPAKLCRASVELGSVAEHRHSGLASLDQFVSTVVGGSWSGEASSAYGGVWRPWREGARQVHLETHLAHVDSTVRHLGNSWLGGADEASRGAHAHWIQGAQQMREARGLL